MSIMKAKKQLLAPSNQQWIKQKEQDQWFFNQAARKNFATTSVFFWKKKLFDRDLDVEGTNQANSWGRTWAWRSWQVKNFGKEAFDFRTKKIPAEKKTFAFYLKLCRLTTWWNPSDQWFLRDMKLITLHRKKQKSRQIWTHRIAVPITKPRYFESVIPPQALFELQFYRGSQSKSWNKI